MSAAPGVSDQAACLTRGERLSFGMTSCLCPHPLENVHAEDEREHRPLACLWESQIGGSQLRVSTRLCSLALVVTGHTCSGILVTKDPLQERGGDDLTFLSFICALNYVRWDRTIILDLGAGAGGSQMKG